MNVMLWLPDVICLGAMAVIVICCLIHQGRSDERLAKIYDKK